MDPAEQALLQALQASPQDWSIRLLIAEKLHQRHALEEAAALIAEAPSPPPSPEQLEKAATYGGLGALAQAQAYIAANPTDGYGHQIAGHLLQHSGNEAQAAKHFAAAQALGAAATYAPHFDETPPEAAPPAHPQPHESAPAHPGPSTTQPLGVPEINQQVPFHPPQPDSPPQRTASGKPPRQVGGKVTAILIAIGVHVLIGIIAFFLVILQPAKDEPEIVAAVIGPPAAKREMQKKNVVKQVKKSTSAAAAAAPVAQLMRASAMAKFALPKVTRTSTGPLGMGEGNLGSGGFGGTGSGLGSGASFFGGTAKGERFLFVLDHSKSMKPNQVNLRNKELDRALKSLNGVQYQVIIFAGAAFYAEKGWRIEGRENVTGPDGKRYRFREKKISDYDFVGSDSMLPKTKWLDASSANKRNTMEFIRKTPLFIGTDWEMALRVGHYMEPPPDVIFFMSDGTGGNAPGPIISLNKKRGSPVINTVAMQTSAGAQQFAAVARGTKGKFTIVDKQGKPIDGFEFLKNPGQFRGRL